MLAPALMTLPCSARPAGLKYTPEASSQGAETPAPTRPVMHALCWSTPEPWPASGTAAASAAAALAITRLRLIRLSLGIACAEDGVPAAPRKKREGGTVTRTCERGG